MNNPLPPNSTIGILGGGQLGRMTAMAAARLGYRCHVFCPEKDGPAEQVCAAATVAPYEDTEAAERFADAVDVITFEFENVPDETLRLIADRAPVRPNPDALRISQDRIVEKNFITGAGIGTAPYAEVTGPATLDEAIEKIGTPAILKTARFGYDGKGQARLADASGKATAWNAIGEQRAVLEGMIDFEREISVIVARGLDGAMQCFDAVENVHLDGILDTTTAPARIDAKIACDAAAIAETLAEKLDLVGLLSVEMFLTRDGKLLVNEFAPRPHNSGHWTIDACVTSQFEQFVRAVCGLKLGSPERHSDAVMKNLIGADSDDWLNILQDPAAKLHLYGKAESRPGRKMGHVTRLSPKSG